MHLQQPLITPDSFHASSPSKPSLAQQTQVTIFFISGNPGLIAYYHTFLSVLSANLTGVRKDGLSFQIYGRSLGGFDLDEGSDSSAKCYDLEEQICFVQSDLSKFMSESARGDASSPNAKGKVVLVGHSVGTYIAMEILRRHRENNRPEAIDLDIIGGIMLFPTVVDIAKSPAGQKLTRVLSLIPQLGVLASFLAALFTYLLPDPVLRYLINAAMRTPPDEVVDTTLAFLRSKRGVRQAIHMGADEMRSITTDKWADDIWGVGSANASEAKPVPRLFFYFGQNDHWVAEQTRDEIIALRGRTSNGPRMLVCEDGVPHAFSLRHSGIMAEKVAGMIGDIMRG